MVTHRQWHHAEGDRGPAQAGQPTCWWRGPDGDLRRRRRCAQLHRTQCGDAAERARRCARNCATFATRAARVVYGAQNYDTTVTGTESDFFLVQDWSFESGRPFNGGRHPLGKRRRVIGQTVKTVLFGQADPLACACASGSVLRGDWGSERQGPVGHAARTRTTRWSCRLRTFQRRISGKHADFRRSAAAASSDPITTVQAAAELILREQRRSWRPARKTISRCAT